MLTGLGHLTIGRGNDDDGAVHVGGTSNHVLDVIGVTRAVDVGIVAVVGRVLDVGSRNGDTTGALLRSLVDSAILEEVGEALLGLALGDGGRQGGLWWAQGLDNALSLSFSAPKVGGMRPAAVVSPFRDRHDRWYRCSRAASCARTWHMCGRRG
jgi:hypothetical protein